MIAVSGTVTDGWEALFALVFAGLLVSGLVDLRRRYWHRRAQRAATRLQRARHG